MIVFIDNILIMCLGGAPNDQEEPTSESLSARPPDNSGPQESDSEEDFGLQQLTGATTQNGIVRASFLEYFLLMYATQLAVLNCPMK
jgi:hypothetical protein